MVVSGGQSGVDRAALDVAMELGIPYGGWCPSGGWAEDLTDAPGLLQRYPAFRPTPSDDPAQRTEWNVRDSDATLILYLGPADSLSPGTDLTRRLAERSGKPWLIADLSATDATVSIVRFVAGLDRGVLNVAGPRESQAPGIYMAARATLATVLG